MILLEQQIPQFSQHTDKLEPIRAWVWDNHNTMLWSILIGYLVLYGVFSYISAKKYGVEYKEKTNETIYKGLLINHIGISFVFLLVAIIGWFNVRHEHGTHDKLSMIILLIMLITQTATAYTTDKEIRVIYRWINRVGYVSALLFSSYYLLFIPTQYMYYIGLLELAIIISMFVFSKIGSADFRILMFLLPLFVITYREWFVLPIVVTLLFASAYQFFRQKELGDNRAVVPIGHILLVTGSLLITWPAFFIIY